MQTAAARFKAAKQAAAAERKAEAELNHALNALRNQKGGYLDDDLEEAEERAADWQALALVATGVAVGMAIGMLVAPRRARA